MVPRFRLLRDINNVLRCSESFWETRGLNSPHDSLPPAIMMTTIVNAIHKFHMQALLYLFCLRPLRVSLAFERMHR